MDKPFVSVIIAALNEEHSIGDVVRAVPRDIANEIIVVDNGSTDRTAEVAEGAGARVITEPRHGYGRAFRAGLRSISSETEIVVFLDGDGSDYPEMMNRLVEPIIEGTHDFVVSSRTRGQREAGSMNWHQVFAGYMVGFFLRLLYGVRATDMGPFRAIRREALERLKATQKLPAQCGAQFWRLRAFWQPWRGLRWSVGETAASRRQGAPKARNKVARCKAKRAAPG